MCVRLRKRRSTFSHGNAHRQHRLTLSLFSLSELVAPDFSKDEDDHPDQDMVLSDTTINSTLASVAADVPRPSELAAASASIPVSMSMCACAYPASISMPHLSLTGTPLSHALSDRVMAVPATCSMTTCSSDVDGDVGDQEDMSSTSVNGVVETTHMQMCGGVGEGGPEKRLRRWRTKMGMVC